MKILAIDTATSACSVALAVAEKINYLEATTPNSHTQHILPMVDELLVKADLQLSQLDGIAFDSGPGSFTGMRIGAAVTQGLAFAHELAVIKVSSLAAMALRSAARYAAVCLDARMEQVYFGKFKFSNSELLQLDYFCMIKPEDLKLDLDIKWSLVGNGWLEYQPQFKFDYLSRFEHIFDVMPHAREIAKLALSPNAKIVKAEEALPMYLRGAV